MIFFSYKFLYKSIVEYYLILLLKKINLPIICKILVSKTIGKFIFKNRMLAYSDYSRLLIEENFQPEIANYDLECDDISEILKYDILDMCNVNYQYTPIYTDFSNIKCKKITYKPDRSGFFSTIFTVINILFYCRFHSIKVYIDWDEWHYDFNIVDCFPKNEKLMDSEQCYFGQDQLFVESRKLIDSFVIGCDNYSKYTMFRKHIIEKVYDNGLKIIDLERDSGINLFDNDIVCFIRRGDKLHRESYPIDLKIYQNILVKYESVVIVGDDYYFNENLSKLTGFPHFTLDNYRPRGGHLKLVSSDAVIAIISNFVILARSKNIIGDPYCNLVAAAMIFKDINKTFNHRLHPWKLRKYV